MNENPAADADAGKYFNWNLQIFVAVLALVFKIVVVYVAVLRDIYVISSSFLGAISTCSLKESIFEDETRDTPVIDLYSIQNIE